jgi:type IV pilus assembly protein PilA
MSTPPPLRTDFPHPSSALPPKKGLSGCAIAAIIVVGVCVVMIPILAILAAIAIPQYQDYVVRTRIVQAYNAATDLQNTIALHRNQHGACPDAQALGMADAAKVKLSPSSPAEAVFVLDPPPSDDTAGCAFEMGFSGLSPSADGKTIRFVSGENGWDCREGTLDVRFRPAQCR